MITEGRLAASAASIQVIITNAEAYIGATINNQIVAALVVSINWRES